MANDRGGLQPFEARDFFYQARDTLKCHKDEVETLIEQMKKTLATNSTATSALRKRIKDLEKAWIEIEAQFNRLRTIAGQGISTLPVGQRLEGLQAYHAALQHHYLEAHARAEAALKKKLPSAFKMSHSSSTTQDPPRLCPACGGTHIATGSNGETYFKTHLSCCKTFTNKSVNERATIIQKARGCILCLDWTGSHQVRTCQAKAGQGKTFDPCKRLVNGSPCGEWHNHLLHGSRNNYCNSEKRVLTRKLGVPNALGKVAPGTPTTNRFSIQKDSSKEPSVEEEQAKEAALRNEAIHQQKITASKRAAQVKADAKKAHKKANDTKAGEKAEKKKATKKATLKEARNKDLLEKGPLETEEGRPPDQDLGTRATTEPIEEPPHDRNDDL